MRVRLIGAVIVQCLAALVATVVGPPIVSFVPWSTRPRYKGFSSEGYAERTHAAIVNGSYAKPKAFPYQVYLRVFLGNGKIDFCGGAIISNRHILTAAHCVKKPNVLHVTAVIGSTNRFSPRALVFRVVKQAFYQPTADEPVEADIAVLMVNRPIPVDGNNIKVVKMQIKRPFKRKMCTVAGWGESNDNSDPNILKTIKVPLVEQKYCRASYPEDPPGDLLCAGYYVEGGLDTCQGDSGSPLVCAGKLTGVVKGGIGCGLPFYPGTYTNVTYYRAWVNRVMEADQREVLQLRQLDRPRADWQRFRYRARRQYSLRPSRSRRG